MPCSPQNFDGACLNQMRIAQYRDMYIKFNFEMSSLVIREYTVRLAESVWFSLDCCYQRGVAILSSAPSVPRAANPASASSGVNSEICREERLRTRAAHHRSVNCESAHPNQYQIDDGSERQIPQCLHPAELRPLISTAATTVKHQQHRKNTYECLITSAKVQPT